MNEDTYVVIPFYNEATVIGDVVRRFAGSFTNVVCVDDGSRDGSAEIVTESGATLVQHAVNLGAGAATQTGIDYALLDTSARYFITFDADGQHDVADAVTMLEQLRTTDVDIVLGSRSSATPRT